MFHSFQTMASILPEAKQALNSAVKKIHAWYNLRNQQLNLKNFAILNWTVVIDAVEFDVVE